MTAFGLGFSPFRQLLITRFINFWDELLFSNLEEQAMLFTSGA